MSRRIAFALAWALSCLPLAAHAATADLVVPNPAKVTRGSGEFGVSASTRLAVARDDAGARRVAANFADLVAKSLRLKLALQEGSRGDDAIRFERVAELAGGPEAYRVQVTPKSVVLTASSDAGFMHATTTLWQLMARAESGSATIPAVTIDDAPRFAWRGLMLDSARHYQSPRFITSLIDWMALHKLNVLHWHLTDDQAWRLEIRKYPRLTEVGAWRVPAGAGARDIDEKTGKPRLYGGSYSQETVRTLVAYAAQRGITIVPEIEMPGHATAAIAAYPELGATAHPPKEVPADWGIYNNVYSLEDSTFAFLEDVLTEVMELFPSPYIHVGGDEVEREQWRESPRARQRLAELGIDDAHAQAYFTQRIGRFLQSRGRRLVGWDEILEPGLAAGAVVMSWRGIDGAVAAAAKGHDTILAAHPTLYFDNRQSASTEEPPGRGRIVSLKDVYAFEPMPSAIRPDAVGRVLGVQANVWTEHIRTEERVAWMLFPRAAAVAELGWSQPDRREWSDFRRRLTALEARYPSVGLVHAAHPFPERTPTLARKSQQMRLCSEDIALSLEDDAPPRGRRAVFLLDVQNPCWIYPQAPLDRAQALVATVGQVPFNFQIGEAVKKIHFPPPTTAEGELEVRLDSCEGELLARLPLARAIANDGVTTLPPAPITPRKGLHDLCLRFAQPKLEPMWAIDSLRIQVAP